MSKLLEIAKIRRLDFEAQLREIGETQYESQLLDMVKLRVNKVGGLYEAMGGSESMFLAAEFKRKSPSKGNIIQTGTTLDQQVVNYEDANVNMISILTEDKHFGGSLDDLLTASKLLRTVGLERPLLLRKDFIIHRMQILEAKAYGADTLLLIVAILSESQLTEFIGESRKQGMEPLVEVATEEEMRIAHQCGAKVIGINNRDLHTFTVDMRKSLRLVEAAPKGDVKYMSLSGIKGREDVATYEDFGHIHGVLIGELLMKSEDPKKLVKQLLGQSVEVKKPLVKICGLKLASDVEYIIQLNVDFVGIIFAPGSKRCASAEDATAIIRTVRNFREQSKPVFVSKPNGYSVDDLRRGLNRSRPLIVGVFQGLNNSEIEQILADTDDGIDVIQLHEKEVDVEREEALCKLRPVIKVVHVVAEDNNKFPKEAFDLRFCSAVLLDSAVGGVSGGTGKTFDWDLVAQFKDQLHGCAEIPLLLAGGLTPENVREAVSLPVVDGVDVSSGVEADIPGRKDLGKVKDFVTMTR